MKAWILVWFSKENRLCWKSLNWKNISALVDKLWTENVCSNEKPLLNFVYRWSHVAVINFVQVVWLKKEITVTVSLTLYLANLSLDFDL